MFHRAIFLGSSLSIISQALPLPWAALFNPLANKCPLSMFALSDVQLSGGLTFREHCQPQTWMATAAQTRGGLPLAIFDPTSLRGRSALAIPLPETAREQGMSK